MIFFLDQGEAQWHQHHQGRATGLLRPRDQMGSARPFLNTGLLWLLAPSGPNVVRTATFPSSGHTSNLDRPEKEVLPCPLTPSVPARHCRPLPPPPRSLPHSRGVTPHRRSVSTQPLSPGDLVQPHVSNADGATRGPDSRGQSWE